jgi:hypothetical protein
MRDRRGVEGLPLRLLVTAAVLALTLPAVASGLLVHDLHRTDDRIRGELARVLTVAGRLALAGGGRATLDLDLRSGVFTSLQSATLRNVSGTGVAEYTLGSQPPRLVTVPGTPPLDLGASGFTAGPGMHTLVLEVDRGTGRVRVTR